MVIKKHTKKLPGDPGTRIRLFREEVKKTQEEFGEPLGVSYRSVCRYEETGEIPQPVLIAIEHIYGISQRWLLHGQGEKHVKPELVGLTAQDLALVKFLKTTNTNLYKIAVELMQLDLGWDGVNRQKTHTKFTKKKRQ